jgi:hypothetical protein
MRKIIAMTSLAGAILCGFQTRCPTPSPSVYQIEFDGKAGTKIFGMYSYIDQNGRTFQRVEKVEATLPYKVTLTPPAGAIVNASASASIGDSEPVTVTIAKDGIDCTHPLSVGSGSINLVGCTDSI